MLDRRTFTQTIVGAAGAASLPFSTDTQKQWLVIVSNGDSSCFTASLPKWFHGDEGTCVFAHQTGRCTFMKSDKQSVIHCRPRDMPPADSLCLIDMPFLRHDVFSVRDIDELATSGKYNHIVLRTNTSKWQDSIVFKRGIVKYV